MRTILIAVLMLLPLSSYAADARMTYKGLNGSTITAGLAVPVCGVDANGVPQICNQSAAPDLSSYITRSEAKDDFATISSLSGYLTSSDAAATYATQVQLNAEATTRANNDALAMPKTGGAFEGTVTAPTPDITDSSAKIATTAYVTGFLSSVDMQVTGDISTAGSSLVMDIPSANVRAVLAYTGSGSASMTFYSISGTVSPVDIRRNSIWGASAVETFTLDGGTLTATGTVADSTIYTASQDSSAYFIRANGNVYFLTVWASGNGARAFIGLHRMI